MSGPTYEPLKLSAEEREVLADLLESERAKLLIEIRHTDHRLFREELRRRLDLFEHILSQCGRKVDASDTSEAA